VTLNTIQDRVAGVYFAKIELCERDNRELTDIWNAKGEYVRRSQDVGVQESLASLLVRLVNLSVPIKI
jgi:hypothetical protein